MNTRPNHSGGWAGEDRDAGAKGLWQLGHTIAERGRRPTVSCGPQREVDQTTLRGGGPGRIKPHGRARSGQAACRILPRGAKSTACALTFLA